jgi:methyl-accepting chemotaxis protein
MSIRYKMILAFGLVCLFSAGVALYAVQTVSALSSLTVGLYDGPLMGIKYVQAAQIDFEKARYIVDRAISTRDASTATEVGSAEKLMQQFAEDLKVAGERMSEAARGEIQKTQTLADDWYRAGMAYLKPPAGGLQELPIPQTVIDKGRAVGEALDALGENAAAYGFDFRSNAEITVGSTKTNLLLLAVGTFLIGLALAAGLAYSVTRPIRKLTAGMLELANGNFDVVLPGLGRKDEIGNVAGAVETFKVMAAEKARHEMEERAEAGRRAMEERTERDRVAAEQRIEADKRTAAEREGATARVMQEFDAAVGGIVQAAMAGDFSQRVPLEGKEGVIRNLAAGLNSICDTIGTVMDDMVRMMSALAEGDLTRRIEAEYYGTFATLKDSANTTAERLSQIVSDVKGAAAEVLSAAAEISTSTTNLSQRTEEQAAGLEETSASMEEMAETVKKNAANAREANQFTLNTREVADRGGKVVATAVDAMSRIEDSSQQISDIIGVIDEIARQTNLLALNAAVEAARAGDAGRGFAVVASEVRSLAQRSSQAAKDIKDLITNSNLQVKEGVELVNRAGVSLTEIVQSIENVATIVGSIANASSEQSNGIDQVNRALGQMDELTQQNSALVEENAATAKTLETQAAAVTQRVSFFRLAEEARPERPAIRPAARMAAA